MSRRLPSTGFPGTGTSRATCGTRWRGTGCAVARPPWRRPGRRRWPDAARRRRPARAQRRRSATASASAALRPARRGHGRPGGTASSPARASAAARRRAAGPAGHRRGRRRGGQLLRAAGVHQHLRPALRAGRVPGGRADYRACPGPQIGAGAAADHSVSAAPVVLAPGGIAHAWLQVADTANFPASKCHPVTAAGLRVTVPGTASASYVAHPRAGLHGRAAGQRDADGASRPAGPGPPRHCVTPRTTPVTP